MGEHVLLRRQRYVVSPCEAFITGFNSLMLTPQLSRVAPSLRSTLQASLALIMQVSVLVLVRSTTCMPTTVLVVLARLKPNLAPLGARFIPYKTLVYLNVWEIKVE